MDASWGSRRPHPGWVWDIPELNNLCICHQSSFHVALPSVARGKLMRLEIHRSNAAANARAAPITGSALISNPRDSAVEPIHAPAAFASWNPAMFTVVARLGALLAALMSFEVSGGIIENSAAPTTNIHGGLLRLIYWGFFVSDAPMNSTLSADIQIMSSQLAALRCGQQCISGVLWFGGCGR